MSILCYIAKSDVYYYLSDIFHMLKTRPVEKCMSYSTFLFFNPAECGYSILFYLYLLHNHVPFGTDFWQQPQSSYSLKTEVRYIFTSTFVTVVLNVYPHLT